MIGPALRAIPTRRPGFRAARCAGTLRGPEACGSCRGYGNREDAIAHSRLENPPSPSRFSTAPTGSAASR